METAVAIPVTTPVETVVAGMAGMAHRAILALDGWPPVGEPFSCSWAAGAEAIWRTGFWTWVCLAVCIRMGE